jgi:hypothetical protein
MGNRLLLALIFLVFACGCTKLKPQTDPGLDKKALGIANHILSLNQNIISSKGTGWVKLETGTRSDRFKIAWAASFPNRLRITFLVSGHPFETIVATGKSVTFISHGGEHKPYTTLSSDPDLKKFIHVPIKLSQMVAILLGHIPLTRFDHAWFDQDDGSSQPIILTKKWRSSFQKLNLDRKGEPRELLVRDKGDLPLYDIFFLDYRLYGDNRIPATLLIRDALGRTIHLSLTLFIPNPPIKESVFRLTESGS